MTEIKKTRTMTAKRFATTQLSARTTAEGFLQAHRNFLQSHTFLTPVLDAYDSKTIYPTVALQVIQSALLTHVLESELKAAESKMRVAQDATGKPKQARVPRGDLSGKPKPYTITLMCKVYNREETSYTVEVGTVEQIVGYKIRTATNGDLHVSTREETEGNIILEALRETNPATWDADDYGAAMRLADRRLFQRGDSVFAVIRNNYGKPIDTTVQRVDAMARILKQPKSAVSKTGSKTTSHLGFQPHAKQTRVTGPWSHR